MEIQDKKLIYNLIVPEDTKANLVIKETTNRMFSELKNNFGRNLKPIEK